MGKVADIFEDQIVPPVDKAVWWIEHAIRTNGGEYLSNPGLDYSFIEYYLLDIAILIATIIILIFVMIYLLIKFTICLCYKWKSKKIYEFQ